MHREMIMINDGNYSVLYDIEKPKSPFEINYIENSAALMKLNFVDTGFQHMNRSVEDGD